MAAVVTAYSETAALLPPGTLATAIPSFFIASASRRSTPAPVICTKVTALFSNRDAGSLGPTAGISSARAVFINAGKSAASGARYAIFSEAGGETPARVKSTSGRRQMTSQDMGNFRLFGGYVLRAFGDFRDGKEAQQHQRFGAGVARDVFFAGRHQQGVAGLYRIIAAVGFHAAFT